MHLRATAPRLLLLGVLLHAALYARGAGGGFTFDDRKIVLEGDVVSGRTPLVAALAREYFPKRTPREGIDYRPLTVLSLGSDVRLFGFSPRAMRLENILLAGLGAGLFAAVVLALGAPEIVAWGTLLLVSCHPVRSEAVLSIVGRSELLAFGLVAASLLLAVRALRGSLAAAGASALLFFLALFSKESAFAAPALLAATAVVLFRGDAERPPARSLLALAAGWCVALVLAFAVRHAVLGGFLTGPLARMDPMDNVLAGLPAAERAGAALGLLPLAALRLVFPVTLVADYGSGLRVEELLAPAAVVSGALLLFLVALAAGLLLLRGKALAGFGLAWALATYVPFSNLFFPTGTVFAERLLTAPAAGVALALAVAAASWRSPRAAVVAFGVVALLGAARLQARVPEWRDDRALFTAAARDLPENGRAWFNLALLSLSEGNAQRARGELTAALRADRRLFPYATGLLAHARRIGKPEAEAAIGNALAAARQ